MSSRTDRPKRALMSLRSMGVMWIVMSIFVWANTRDRSRVVTNYRIHRNEGVFAVTLEGQGMKLTCRGFPWVYHAEPVEDAPFGLVKMVRHQPGRNLPSGPMVGPASADTRHLLLNLAVALIVSITLALASERFVFSKLRRRRPTGEASGPARPPDSGA